jgi:hypothetical protein
VTLVIRELRREDVTSVRRQRPLRKKMLFKMIATSQLTRPNDLEMAPVLMI